MSAKVYKLRKYNKHRKNWFYACNINCANGFKEDRKQGLIYGPYYLKSKNRFALNAEEFSRITKTCPYCGCRDGQPK